MEPGAYVAEPNRVVEPRVAERVQQTAGAVVQQRVMCRKAVLLRPKNANKGTARYIQ